MTNNHQWWKCEEVPGGLFKFKNEWESGSYISADGNSLKFGPNDAKAQFKVTKIGTEVDKGGLDKIQSYFVKVK